MAEIILRHDDDEITITSPYSETLRQALNTLPRPDRRWDPTGACWRVQPQYLDTVRLIADRVAKDARWTLRDYTARSPAANAAEIRARIEAELEAQISAFLKVLPALPANSLILADWQPGRAEAVLEADAASPPPLGTIYLEVAGFLGERQFKQLRQEVGLRKVGGDPSSGSSRWTMALPDDPRIVRALWARGDVRHLRAIEGLHLIRSPNKGRFELSRLDDGRIWLGTRYQQIRYQPGQHPSPDWPVAVVGDEVLIAFEREIYFQNLLHKEQPLIQLVELPTTRSASPAERLTITTQAFDCLDWLKSWTQMLVESDEVSRRPLHGSKGREARNYHHPAEALLRLLGDDDRQINEGQALAGLLGWSVVEVKAARSRIEDLKATAATAKIAADRAEAAERARPILAQRSRAELLALAAEWQVPISRSAKKAQLIEALVSHQPLAERLIGL